MAHFFASEFTSSKIMARDNRTDSARSDKKISKKNSNKIAIYVLFSPKDKRPSGVFLFNVTMSQLDCASPAVYSSLFSLLPKQIGKEIKAPEQSFLYLSSNP